MLMTTAPGDLVLDVLLKRSFQQLSLPRLGDASGIEIGEKTRLGVAREVDLGSLLRGRVLEAFDEPGLRPGEHLFGPALDQRPAHALIAVVDVDEARPGLVGAGGRVRNESRNSRASSACSG